MSKKNANLSSNTQPPSAAELVHAAQTIAAQSPGQDARDGGPVTLALTDLDLRDVTLLDLDGKLAPALAAAPAEQGVEAAPLAAQRLSAEAQSDQEAARAALRAEIAAIGDPGAAVQNLVTLRDDMIHARHRGLRETDLAIGELTQELETAVRTRGLAQDRLASLNAQLAALA